jgi:uncharacterized protein (DUF111 family)
MPMLVPEKVGYGLGARDNVTRPNVLRMVLGTAENAPVPHDWETDTIAVLETNLDDVTPEILGSLVEKGLAAGALDVFHTPVLMKKNRPGVLLTILCSEADAERFTEFLLVETTSFGVRRSLAERRKLRRSFIDVQTRFGPVRVKIGSLDGATVQFAPEFESCRAVAEKAGVPVKDVYQAALAARV